MSKQGKGEHAMSEVTKPPRVIGTIGASLMSVNGMIGAGIFALPALLYAKTGAFAPWMFLIFGVLYACGVLIAAQLATMFRSSGGPQLYAQAAFGPMVGFQVGWLLVIAIAAGQAATLYVLVSYLAVFFPALAGPIARPVAVLALLVMLGGLTLSGMRRALDGLVVGTVLKITPIVALCIAAFVVGGHFDQLPAAQLRHLRIRRAAGFFRL
jgi:amino acid transporter